MAQMTNCCGNVTIDVAFPSPGSLESAAASLVYFLLLLFFCYFWQPFPHRYRIAPYSFLIAGLQRSLAW